MIGKGIAAAIARRGFLGGALGLGAAAGLGVKPSGAVIGGAQRAPPPMPSVGMGTALAQNPVGQLGQEPAWLKRIYQDAREQQIAESERTRFDSLDLDLAMLRSPSPAYKLVMQARRDRQRRRASMTLWERVNEAREKWMRGLG